MKNILIYIGMALAIGCSRKIAEKPVLVQQQMLNQNHHGTVEEEKSEELLPEFLQIEKNFVYDRYTLADSYPYKNSIRTFQWGKIHEILSALESVQKNPVSWAILQNYKNRNGEPPLTRMYQKDVHNRITDIWGVGRYQAVPLYSPTDTVVPERYGRDGTLVKYIKDDCADFVKVITSPFKQEWLVPANYIKPIADNTIFEKAIFIDRSNQNIATLEKDENRWLVRSMNPATTGLHNPPYMQETPLGVFVLQEKKAKMLFLRDGTLEIGGFAPHASRFSSGAYIHGVPVNSPQTSYIEYSQTLGTYPRSHMCVRNATSHAEFIYNWATVEETLIFIFD